MKIMTDQLEKILVFLGSLIISLNLSAELSYDELSLKLEIKVRKRLTDSMTILRKNMWVSQTKNGVKLTSSGIQLIEKFV